MTGRRNAELAGGGALGDPLVEQPATDQLPTRHSHALTVERTRTQPAQAQRIVDNRNAVAEDRLAELVLEEAGLAGDGRTGDRPGEMAEQGRGDAAVEQHRIFARFRTPGVEPRDRAFPSAAADLRSRLEVFEMARAV